MDLLLGRSRVLMYVSLLLMIFCGCHSHGKKGQLINTTGVINLSDTTSDVKTIVTKVNALEAANRLEDAITYITGNLKRFSGKDKGILLNERGSAYFLKDDFENALTNYLAAVDIEPDNPTYIINVAKTYEALESLTNASFFANKILTLQNASDSEKTTARGMIQRWDQIHAGH